MGREQLHSTEGDVCGPSGMENEDHMERQFAVANPRRLVSVCVKSSTVHPTRRADRSKDDVDFIDLKHVHRSVCTELGGTKVRRIEKLVDDANRSA